MITSNIEKTKFIKVSEVIKYLNKKFKPRIGEI